MLGALLPIPAVIGPLPPSLPAHIPTAHAAVGPALEPVLLLPIGDIRLPVTYVALLLHVLDVVLLSHYRP